MEMLFIFVPLNCIILGQFFTFYIYISLSHLHNTGITYIPLSNSGKWYTIVSASCFTICTSILFSDFNYFPDQRGVTEAPLMQNLIYLCNMTLPAWVSMKLYRLHTLGMIPQIKFLLVHLRRLVNASHSFLFSIVFRIWFQKLSFAVFVDQVQISPYRNIQSTSFRELPLVFAQII